MFEAHISTAAVLREVPARDQRMSGGRPMPTTAAIYRAECRRYFTFCVDKGSSTATARCRTSGHAPMARSVLGTATAGFPKFHAGAEIQPFLDNDSFIKARGRPALS